MKVSVIVPMYNVSEFAEECIESIVNQTYKDLEIILVDDGSTDETASIIDAWASKDARIKVVHQKNGGLSAARNTGMARATGDCLAFIDGDDAIKDRYFEVLVKNMMETNADLACVSRYENIPGENTFKEFSSVDDLFIYNDYRDYVYDTYMDKGKRFFQSAIVVWGKLFKREVWEGIEFPVGRINEDSWIFPNVMSRCNKIVISSESLYFYRKRNGSIMSKVTPKLVCSKTDSWMQQIKWWRESNDSSADKLLSVCEKYICHYIYKNVQYFTQEYKESIKKEYKSMIRHMLASKYLSYKTKVKYLTYASSFVVFR